MRVYKLTYKNSIAAIRSCSFSDPLSAEVGNHSSVGYVRGSGPIQRPAEDALGIDSWGLEDWSHGQRTLYASVDGRFGRGKAGSPAFSEISKIRQSASYSLSITSSHPMSLALACTPTKLARYASHCVLIPYSCRHNLSLMETYLLSPEMPYIRAA